VQELLEDFEVHGLHANIEVENYEKAVSVELAASLA
jgi:hypothetical protein